MKKLILGNVYTAEKDNMEANAIIVNDGIIEYVGNKEEALKRIGNNFETLDYKNNYIYPGFIEAHCHGYFAGNRAKGQADLSNTSSDYSGYAPVIKSYIEKNPGKKLYVAFGWNETIGELDHTFLDDIYDKGPLVLNTIGGHSCLLNKKGMELFGINEDLLKKWGSNLVHTLPNGKPSGYICEGPAVELLGHLPISIEDAKEYILEWQNIAFSKGITACCDAGAELLFKDANIAYHELEKENKLKLRTYSFSLVKDNEEDAKAAVEHILDIKKEYDGKYFKTIGAKAFLDGVGEARTSWTVDEYNDEKGYHGLQRFADEKLMVNLLNETAKHNLAVHVHSEGDGATKFMLECVKKSQDITKNYDQRNIVAHLHFVKPEDFKNMASTNSIPLTAPLWSPKFPGVYDKDCKVFGKDRADSTYPVKSFLDEGAKVCYHSDYPISSILDISRSFFMAEKRSLPEEKERGLGDTSCNVKEAVSRNDSLNALTINCAYALHAENEIGSIKEGKIANFAVFDKDLLHDDAFEIIKAKTIATIVDGEVVFS